MNVKNRTMAIAAWLVLAGAGHTTWGAPADPWPAFYGEYPVMDWICEANVKDSGCLRSARVTISNTKGVTVLSVFDAAGRMIRSNDLVDKAAGNVKYSLSGSESHAQFTAELFNGRGDRVSYTLLRIEYADSARDRKIFSQVQESHVPGRQIRIKRVFLLGQ